METCQAQRDPSSSYYISQWYRIALHQYIFPARYDTLAQQAENVPVHVQKKATTHSVTKKETKQPHLWHALEFGEETKENHTAL